MAEDCFQVAMALWLADYVARFDNVRATSITSIPSGIATLLDGSGRAGDRMAVGGKAARPLISAFRRYAW